MEGMAMSDSRGGKVDEVKARLKDAVAGSEGDVDAELLMTRVRDVIGKAGSDVDTDALVARVKDVAGKAEGTVDAEKLKQWVHEVDTEKLKSWLNEAKTMGAGAAAMAGVQGEKLAERAPGMFDKVLGAAKEMLGDLTGNEELTHAGELEQLKGDIKERYADAGPIERTASEAADTAKKTD
jgi:uncharacterized protein YjbJ (UPF0337 family)